MPNTLQTVVNHPYGVLIEMKANIRTVLARLLFMAVRHPVSQGTNEAPCQENAQYNQRLHF